MTDLQYLLLKLMEECAELSQEASKGHLFGVNDVNLHTGVINKDAIAREAKDVCSILSILQEEHGINFIPSDDEHREKVLKLKYYKGIHKEIEKAGYL